MAGTLLQPRNYAVFEPSCIWSRAKECDTLVVNVPGFKKEQVQVLINTRRKLKISGERQVDGNRWSRFNKEFRISNKCNIRGVHATFDKDRELLCVVLPKSSSQTKPQHQATQVGDPPISSKPIGKMDSSRGGQAGKPASHDANLEGRGSDAVMVVGKDLCQGEEEFPIKSEVSVDVGGIKKTSGGSGGLFKWLRKIKEKVGRRRTSEMLYKQLQF
ncbi:uncharacterized protein [Typha latifolia]|uniref:uncharacterized protein n=1 Tax=Typha latifolia TaxID=4733 RepID=UPI003C2C785D